MGAVTQLHSAAEAGDADAVAAALAEGVPADALLDSDHRQVQHCGLLS